MLAIGVRYLCGWSMAATYGAAKQHTEWPPHPDRLFMALTAACFEGDSGAASEAALGWLEQQPPPALSHSLHNERQIVTHFVPVNDTRVPKPTKNKAPSAGQIKTGLSLLPENRSRQPRQFPVAIPHDPDVYFIWPEAEAGPHQGALETLCRNITSLGHSASLVQAWVEEHPPEPTLLPTNGIGDHKLRVSGPGRLRNLTDWFNADAILRYQSLTRTWRAARGKQKKVLKEEIALLFPNGEPKCLRPEPARAQGYRKADRAVDEKAMIPTVFDHRLLILRRQSGKPLGLESTLLLTETLRNTVLAAGGESKPEWLCGHDAGNRPSKKPHMALFPLPHVGREHADGHLLGVAIVLPGTVPEEEVHGHLEWLARFDDEGQPLPVRLFQGRLLDWQVVLEQAEHPPRALRMETWTGPSRHWATVTPLVFDRHPRKSDREAQTAAMVAKACERIGLPAPSSIQFIDVSPFQGVPHRRRFPPLLRKSDGGRMHHSHLILCFEKPVLGPVLLGAGRFRGYGLCRPYDLFREE
jgi:CRISPR-associated protein Csb2